jgi:hypothetical protein
MNIFYLSNNPKKAAEYHLDKHVVKMILESAQLLCTSHRILDGTQLVCQETTKSGNVRNIKRYILSNNKFNKLLYNATHINHPCAKWVRDSINNYDWLYQLFIHLCDEYTFRYGKKHKTDILLRELLKTAPKNIPNTEFTLPAQAMPKQYKSSDPVIAYRNYYINEKHSFAKWTIRKLPNWFSKGIGNANI